MILGGIDLVEATKLQKKLTRKESESRQHSASTIGSEIQFWNPQERRHAHEEYTLSKSHWKPHLLTPETKRQKIRITVRLPSLWLKLALELASSSSHYCLSCVLR